MSNTYSETIKMNKRGYSGMREAIKKLSKEKNAIILAHNYQPAEIQDTADITGDSLELARIAAKNDSDIIVFCGVHFMAESASILAPEKTVLLPDKHAGCPMADMVQVNDLLELKAEHPDARVVAYINSSAAVKAHCDVICTSSNAVKIVQRIDAQKIIFIPDRNLGAYVQKFTDKEIILWEGFCPTHERFTVEQLNQVKAQHPDALVMVHPECNPPVIEAADKVFSTGEMVSFVKETKEKKIIVGTESGMIHKLKSVNPDIEYIEASDAFICPNMKKITLEKLYNALVQNEVVIKVDNETAEKAKKALDAMLELSY